ncbi:MAG: Ig-like domain-containing protein [Hyphomicrobiaceae bacterium]
MAIRNKAAAVKPTVKITSQKLTADTGASATDLITNNGAVKLAGTMSGPTGTTVQIYDGPTLLGTAKLDAKGGWSFSTTLPAGTHALHAVAATKSGVSVATADQPAIVVDKSAPTVAYKYESQVVGSNAVDLWGTVSGAAGTTVKVFANGVDIGMATVTGTTWHMATLDLAPGNYSFSAVATTLAGNSATFSGIPSLTVGQVSGTLDLTKYSKVWEQDFTASSAINTDIFPIVYGNPDQFSFGPNGLTLSSYRADGFANVGFLQANWEPTLSQGYGLYSVTASAPVGQGTGIAILLWPANNVWPGPEIDILENWSDPTGQTGYMSVHFKGPNGEDMANSIKFSVDLSQQNTFALDWQDGSLTYYINGVMLFQITGSEVPKDAAHGGINAAFGAQVTDIGSNFQPTDTVSLTIYDMSYSVLNPVGDVFKTNGGTGGLIVPSVQKVLDVMAMDTPASAFTMLPSALIDVTEPLVRSAFNPGAHAPWFGGHGAHDGF